MYVLRGLTLLAFLLPGSVFAAGSIETFDARISVHADATIDVTEQIVYNFGDVPRHGILRTIPYSYQASSTTYTADISNVSVVDENGSQYQFNESRSGGELTLKIGDPDAFVTGPQTYVLSYKVTGPFLYFEKQEELYWNVTGTWPTSIGRASVLVDLPAGAVVLDSACYQGGRGTTGRCDEDQRLINVERAGYTAVANNLAPYEGLTVAVAFPKGTIKKIAKPWEEERKLKTRDYWPLGIPFLALIIVLQMWYTRGRDPRGRETIVTEFSPPEDVSPALAGIIYNEKIEPREISAEIVRLAVGGYIKIHRIEKAVLIFTTTDYIFERVNSEKTPEEPVQELILDKLFQPDFAGTGEVEGKTVAGTLLSKMQNKFASEREEIVDMLYDDVYSRGYFVDRPDKVRQRYAIGAVVMIFAGIFGAMAGAEVPKLALIGVAVALAGIPIGIIGLVMPAKTRRGVRVHEHLEGFKRYLAVAEKDRLAFHNAPDRTREEFDAFLPYAMAFGVEEAWAEQFKDMYTEEPNWYTGGGDQPFGSSSFVTDLSMFSSDFTSASAPRSSGSSGGGSVGGGFGGGGGGTW